LADNRLQNIPLVLETPSFESTEIWTKEVEVLNQLSIMGNTDEDQAAMAAMKTEIEDVVKRVGGGANTAAKSGRRQVGSSKSPPKRGRKKREEDDEENENSDHDAD
jgi:AP endonuclease 1